MSSSTLIGRVVFDQSAASFSEEREKMGLDSGTYAVRTDLKVVTWKAPDKNGTTGPIWEDRYDTQGRSMGRAQATDKEGNPIQGYPVPDGFVNRPTSDKQDCWVLVDEFGEFVRQPNGEAVNIKPGQALVFQPDGSVTVLADEYEQYVFANAHDVVSVDETPKKSKK